MAATLSFPFLKECGWNRNSAAPLPFLLASLNEFRERSVPVNFDRASFAWAWGAVGAQLISCRSIDQCLRTAPWRFGARKPGGCFRVMMVWDES